MKNEIMERFIKYVKMDTQSNEASSTIPTTPGQLELGRVLVAELKHIGLEEVTMDENGYVMATLPSNSTKKLATIGFLAHLDTATDMTGTNVSPQIHENFDGKAIVLNEGLGVVLSPESFPELPTYKGQTLITTDGTTLLGADDKAGITEIIVAMNYLINHPEIKHGRIRVAFTPDEEIGRGPQQFDVEAFDAEFAYTMDGGPLGELEYENFNAAAARITFKGNSVHPGTAKDKMVNANKIAMEFHSYLPAEEVPEKTEGYEGFYHLISLNGDVEVANSYYIIRDFDHEGFLARKATISDIAKQLQAKYGESAIELEMNDQYYNMKEKVEPVKEIVDIAYKAMKNLDIEPDIRPIRGGTDGAQLSFKGLPTPNIFTGGENYHGKFEYISVDSMVKATQVIIEIAQLFEQEA
ncbi:peptidase T [Listeria weihenstephanensis FSL R9-0317]|uniref:Peptidase T n=1 Tax=Listeria weihenstephanensis TaxID=1006155 RepID=A0A1S7FW22_9LIST|nr:peptidase T [Listeria weihenstephanensis]AQY51599.1 peptidase T [Listeria weihenstephanensis]EUJ34879.1 peptidase T [Listeria weihenstephanensis FSL R9-0317]